MVMSKNRRPRIRQRHRDQAAAAPVTDVEHDPDCTCGYGAEEATDNSPEDRRQAPDRGLYGPLSRPSAEAVDAAHAQHDPEPKTRSGPRG